MTPKRKPVPTLSAAPNAADHPPITAANCANLKFARRIARQLHSGHGGKLHQRDRLRRASRATHEMEAFKHLYLGTYSDDEQRERDQSSDAPGDPVHYDDALYYQPRQRDPWAHLCFPVEPAPYPSHRTGAWNATWTPAFDRARAAANRSLHPQ